MTTSSPLDVLKAARELLSDPKRWTQEVLARDASGKPVALSRSSDVACMCSLGALLVASRGTEQGYEGGFYALADTLLADHDSDQIGEFNDTHTHAEVLDLFDRTIARLEAQS